MNWEDMILTVGYYKGTRCDALTPRQLLECFGIRAVGRGASAWLRLCNIVAQERPESSLEGFRCYEMLRDELAEPDTLWQAMADDLMPILTADVSTMRMFGLPPWSHPLMLAIVMGWRIAPESFDDAEMLLPTVDYSVDTDPA